MLFFLNRCAGTAAAVPIAARTSSAALPPSQLLQFTAYDKKYCNCNNRYNNDICHISPSFRYSIVLPVMNNICENVPYVQSFF